VTLKEMALQYRANIAPWKERAALVRKEIAACSDPRQRLALEQRLRLITQIYREGRETARIMETYYEARRDPYVPKKKTGPLSHLSKQ